MAFRQTSRPRLRPQWSSVTPHAHSASMPAEREPCLGAGCDAHALGHCRPPRTATARLPAVRSVGSVDLPPRTRPPTIAGSALWSLGLCSVRLGPRCGARSPCSTGLPSGRYASAGGEHPAGSRTGVDGASRARSRAPRPRGGGRPASLIRRAAADVGSSERRASSPDRLLTGRVPWLRTRSGRGRVPRRGCRPRPTAGSRCRPPGWSGA